MLYAVYQNNESKSTGKKAARRMLMKLTSVVNFINVSRANFTYQSLFVSFFYSHVTREKLPKRLSYVKGACKRW